MPRVGYICSLGHSGSTVLELWLAKHPQAIGLGTIGSQIRWTEMHPSYCSCGAIAAECTFWGRVLPETIRMRREGIPQRQAYAFVINEASDAYPGQVILDSSKNIEPLTSLKTTGADVRVIRLTRDVRSWSIASINNAARKGFPINNLARRFEYSVWGRFRRWYLLNKRMDAAAADYPAMRCGYEEFASYGEVMLGEIWDFLGLGQDNAIAVEGSVSHTLGGNQTTLRSDERQGQIRYSIEWLARYEWLLPSILMSRTMSYNSEAVYSNNNKDPLRKYFSRTTRPSKK